MDSDRPFPCLDDSHTYTGCLGAACPVERCWNGRRVRPISGRVRVDAFDRPLKVLRYTASDCPNCKHAVDLQVEGELRSPGRHVIKQWTICELGLWAGPASLYNLLNHRAPVTRVGHCASFDQQPPDQMRPELLQKRAADQARSRDRRARLKELKRSRQDGDSTEQAA